MDKRKLKKIIKILVERAFLYEKDEPGIDLSDPVPDDKTETTVDDTSNNSTGGSTSIGSDTAVDPTSDIDSPENTTETPLSNEPDLTDAGTTDISSASGGLSGGGAGAAASFSSVEIPSDDNTSQDNPTEPTPEESFEQSISKDPIKDTIDTALKLTKEVGDNQIILNFVKSNMQKYFADFYDAVPIIQGLWDTNDPKLKIVARKLIMFIHGD